MFFRAIDATNFATPTFVRPLPIDPKERLGQHYKCPELTSIEETQALADVRSQLGSQ